MGEDAGQRIPTDPASGPPPVRGRLDASKCSSMCLPQDWAGGPKATQSSTPPFFGVGARCAVAASEVRGYGSWRPPRAQHSSAPEPWPPIPARLKRPLARPTRPGARWARPRLAGQTRSRRRSLGRGGLGGRRSARWQASTETHNFRTKVGIEAAAPATPKRPMFRIIKAFRRAKRNIGFGEWH